VLFRFRFAAGLTCNNYDGFAIDDVVIGEAPANTGDFTYACAGNRRVDFTSSASLCVTSYAWDFGDPASGASNTSTQTSPSHTYNNAGDYLVTLTNGIPGCMAQDTMTVSITPPISFFVVQFSMFHSFRARARRSIRVIEIVRSLL